ncbi:aldehyde dehydrogenase [Vibrio sp. Isolate31]|uniref:aldehyde dehydrogenase n=1 Tax=unclassified Vibrio TaxID=2614977 RepID=UPI001EFDF2A2|nr:MULTISPECIES: aldehyde dehydrogenase [unclassified Vibrio]MCG9555137.1 aldehyde dehydrogenase [Vibrio sp. Isolate32]MCG9602889.1 aldehyde dehydrogenase [Vibrio sp. Isolate31]
MSKQTKEYWKKKLHNLSLPSKAFINGEFIDADDGSVYETINPATGEIIVKVSACSSKEVDLAVTAARSSYKTGVWSNKSPRERKAVLKKLALLIIEHKEELALMESLNVGKPIQDALDIDIPGSAGCFEWYAESIDKIYGEIAPTDMNNVAMITKEPVGVVAAIVPWNFPLDIAAWKLAPALITGNSVVLKPAEQSPMTALKLAELAKEAGLPDGVLNVVTGYGAIVGKALGVHDDVDCLAFTGSTEVGKLFMAYSAQSNMKPVWPETGGKSPNLIFSDCDLDLAVDHAVKGVFFNQGEVCSSNSRILIQNSIKKEFVKRFVSKTRSLVVGDPLDPETQVGALIDMEHASSVRKYIYKASEQGATLLTGGCGDQSSAVVMPTIFDDVSPKMEIANEEVFGPVAALISFDTEEEAISIANDSVFGLAASVWTRDINRCIRVSKKLKAGTISINTMDALDFGTPFGGFKQSGFGRDLSLHAIDKFVQLKTTWIKLS